VTEFAIEMFAADAPLHVIAIRTPTAKYTVYGNWTPNGIDLLPAGQESELYDYATASGRLELHTDVGHNRLTETLDTALLLAFAQEPRAPLPARLLAARAAGLDDYLYIAKADAVAATAHRLRQREHHRDRLPPCRGHVEPI
jgi:hypothetical protein